MRSIAPSPKKLSNPSQGVTEIGGNCVKGRFHERAANILIRSKYATSNKCDDERGHNPGRQNDKVKWNPSNLPPNHSVPRAFHAYLVSPSSSEADSLQPTTRLSSRPHPQFALRRRKLAHRECEQCALLSAQPPSPPRACHRAGRPPVHRHRRAPTRAR